MGYACYDTPHGEAGYGVDDICHTDGCDEAIDRGLGCLCGDHPVVTTVGCGWWFCPEHLFLWGVSGATYLCPTCHAAAVA